MARAMTISGGNHGGDSNGDDGINPAMKPAVMAAGVAQRGQSLEQTSGLLSAQGIVPRRRLSPIGRPGGGHNGCREDQAGVASQRVEEDGFGVLAEVMEIQAGASPAFGHSDFNPVGSAIASAFEALGIRIGFDQGDGVVVALLPVLAEASEVEAQGSGIVCDGGGMGAVVSVVNENNGDSYANG
jgi:hypothetical protein